MVTGYGKRCGPSWSARRFCSHRTPTRSEPVGVRSPSATVVVVTTIMERIAATIMILSADTTVIAGLHTGVGPTRLR